MTPLPGPGLDEVTVGQVNDVPLTQLAQGHTPTASS
jgi:hypothetical protein